MRVWLYLALVCRFLTSVSFEATAQAVWKRIEPEGLVINQDLTAMRFYPDGSGYVVMEDYRWDVFDRIREPIVYYTQDRGDSWIIRGIVPVENSVFTIDQLHDSVCFLGGQDGLNFRSTDSCQTFQAYYSSFGFLNDAQDTYFFNHDTGIAASYFCVWKTYNGGVSWIYKHCAPSIGRSQLFITEDSSIYLFGKSTFLSQNQGEHWSLVGTNPGGFSSGHLFEDGLMLFSYEAPSLMESRDYGVTWTRRDLDIPGLHSLDALHFYSSVHGIGAGHTTDSNVIVLHTSDRGYTWQAIFLDTSLSLSPNFQIKMQVMEDGTVYLFNFNYPYLLRGENYGITSVNSPALPSMILQSLPNPVSGRALLYWEQPLQDAEVEIINALGAVVRNFSGLQGQQLEWSAEALPPGMYWARLSSQGQIRATLPIAVAGTGR